MHEKDPNDVMYNSCYEYKGLSSTMRLTGFTQKDKGTDCTHYYRISYLSRYLCLNKLCKEMLYKTDLCQCNMKASEFENKDLDTNHHQGALTHNTSHILDLDLCKCVYCMSQQ